MLTNMETFYLLTNTNKHFTFSDSNIVYTLCNNINILILIYSMKLKTLKCMLWNILTVMSCSKYLVNNL